MIMFHEHQEYIAAVTKALNELPVKAPEGMALQVRLVDVHAIDATPTGVREAVLGFWLDEHGEDNWYFDTDTEGLR